MNHLWNDIRHGARNLRKEPGFTVVAVLTLALSIGANSTVFSWINATLLNPIPGASQPGRLLAIARGRSASFSYPDFLDLQKGAQSFSSLTATSLLAVSITGRERPERAWAMPAAANYFDVLGVHPVLGRGFLPEEDAPGAPPSVVISYRLWLDRFSGARDVLGRTLPINSREYTIVGVAPPGFQGSNTGLRMDLWVALMLVPQLSPDSPAILTSRNTTWLNMLGRLRPGATREQAQAELTGLFGQMARDHPDEHKGTTVINAYPLWRAPNGGNSIFSRMLPILLGIAGIVLLLACANLANLLLARGAGRQRELAIRLSLGASRARLVRQLLAENLVLSLAGGVLALAATAWTAGSLMKFAPISNLPIWLDVPVDQHVFAVTLAISLLATFLFGSLPALRSSALDPAGAMKGDSSGAGGRRKGLLSHGLAVAQIALSLLLLVCAGLLIRSFRATRLYDPGFNPRNVLLESYDLTATAYTPAQAAAFNRQVLEKARTLPGAQNVALADWVPLGFGSSSDAFIPEGYVAGKQEAIEAGIAHVSPGYLATLAIPLVSGRDFSEHDSADSAPVVIVNQALVDRYWPGQQAVGRRLRIEGKWATAIGVARTAQYYDLDEPPRTFIYLPLEQFPAPELTLHVRVSEDPMDIAAAAAQRIHELNPNLPVFDTATLEARISAITFGLRMAGMVSAAFGLLALILAAVGVYGVLAYSTQQRTREMGIRMALGAQPGDVLRRVLRESLWMLLAGSSAGLLAALGASRLLARLLFGVTPTDPGTYFGVTLVLMAVALTACYLPARRAVRLDPLMALRHE
jgi:predicted permease